MKYERARITNLKHTTRGFKPSGRHRFNYLRPAFIEGVAFIGEPRRTVQPTRLEVYSNQSTRIYREEFHGWSELPVSVIPVPRIEVPGRGFIVLEWKGKALELHLFHRFLSDDERQLTLGE